VNHYVEEKYVDEMGYARLSHMIAFKEQHIQEELDAPTDLIENWYSADPMETDHRPKVP
jgi:hypothetical protein